MSKETARIWFKVTEVRVERIQDITVIEMIKEGILVPGCAQCLESNGKCNSQISEDAFCGLDEQVEDKFSYLRDSTIKKANIDRYGWDANPWVWVIKFE